MAEHFTHLDRTGAARIVDVSEKASTHRRATATCTLLLEGDARELLANSDDRARIFGAARLAGILGAKDTSRLIPLCHPLRIDSVTVALEMVDGNLEITVHVAAFERTGVEMEALTACSTAALAVMSEVRHCESKPILVNLCVLEKAGGRSGDWRRHELVDPSPVSEGEATPR